MKSRSTLKIVNRMPSSEEIPLCVDLDDTLVKTDTLLESLLLLVKRNLFNLFLLPLWLLKGKAYFKRQVARRATVNATLLPYQTAFLDYLRDQHQCGRTMILTTAADASIANRIA